MTIRYRQKTIDGWEQKLFIERTKEYNVFNIELWTIDPEGYIKDTKKDIIDNNTYRAIDNSCIWERV